MAPPETVGCGTAQRGRTALWVAGSAAVSFPDHHIALVAPSFQLLEPRSVDVNLHEGVGAKPIALGVCALLLIAYSFFRVIATQARTTQVVTRWLEGARPLKVHADSDFTFQSRRETPPLTLVGVSNPRVLVSESTVALLSHDELHIALRHELEHLKSHDNLKKLIFRFCPFPGMAKLENAWSHAAELAADDAAVSSQRDAVDLAAALVKLSRLVPIEVAPICSVGFVMKRAKRGESRFAPGS
jgi:beta-lactamase regulating signal transducer with metallopeptidase domain